MPPVRHYVLFAELHLNFLSEIKVLMTLTRPCLPVINPTTTKAALASRSGILNGLDSRNHARQSHSPGALKNFNARQVTRRHVRIQWKVHR